MTMDGVTSGFDVGESLDSLHELRIENNFRTSSARFADVFHGVPQYSLYDCRHEQLACDKRTVRLGPW